MAKDVTTEDSLITVVWDSLTSQKDQDPFTWTSETLENMQYTASKVERISVSDKSATMYVNGDESKRYSLEQTILFQRNGVWMFATTAGLEVGDNIVETDGENFNIVEVTSIDVVDEERTVYWFSLDPDNVFIAGGVLVHNGKTKF